MKIPFLHNIRRGLATNSSSSHSLVFFRHEAASDDIDSASGVDTEFQWNYFTLDTLGEKLMYALTQAIGQGWRPDASLFAELREQWAPLFPEFDGRDDLWNAAFNGSVDHQSSVIPDEAWIEKIRDPHVVIYGGNDNDSIDPVTGREGSGRYGAYADEHELPEVDHRESINGW